jgi:hypothetical protein
MEGAKHKLLTIGEFKSLINDSNGVKNLSNIRVQIGSDSLVIEEISRHIRFHNCIFEGKVTLKHSCNNPGSIIRFDDNCIFESRTEIIIAQADSLHLESCVFQGELIFESCFVNNITIRDCSFQKRVQFNKINPQSKSSPYLDIVIDDTIKQSSRSKRINKVLFDNIDSANISIRSFNCGKVFFENKGIYQNINIYAGIYDEINFGNSKYQNIVIGTYGFEVKSKINSINLSMNSHITGEVTIQRALINHLYVPQINNIKAFRFLSLELRGHLNIPSSNLTGFIFNDIDLTSEGVDIALVGSQIEKAVFSNIQWPKKHLLTKRERLNGRRLSGTEGKKNKRFYRENREIYRQLKNAAKNSSNYIDAVAFRRNELEYYYLAVKANEPVWFSNEWFILWVGKFFSNFGESIIKPIFISACSNLIFLFAAAYFNQELQAFLFDPCTTKTVILEKILFLFFLSFNPLYSFEFVNSALLVLLDTLRKIILGTSIYYILKATRKYANL